MAQKTDYQNIFHWAETQKDGSIPSFATRDNDPYEYLSGFNNHHESEAVPGTIPRGQNNPRVVRFGLYAEQMSDSFGASRQANRNSWLYRSRPAVAHQGFVSSMQVQLCDNVVHADIRNLDGYAQDRRHRELFPASEPPS